MRPLIVDLGRDFRGGQHQALFLLQGLLERGHAPELVALRDSPLASRARQIGVTVHLADPSRRRVSAALQIRKLLRERRVDILHANEPHALTSAWLTRAHRAVPMVISRRIALSISKSFLSRARYLAATRIIAVSDFVKQSVIQCGFAADRIAVIYDGVQIPPAISRSQREKARAQLAIPQANICIGNVAAFVPEKGHVLLLEAFAKLRARFPVCILLLRGEGPELPNIQSFARQLRVDDAVKFLPTATEIETLFTAADIFAFPSHAEPLGSALLAAMAHGLPVVAIARGGVPEAVEDGKTGLLATDLSPEIFCSALARLVAHPDEATRLGNAAREAILARFSADRMVTETLRQYEGLVTGT